MVKIIRNCGDVEVTTITGWHGRAKVAEQPKPFRVLDHVRGSHAAPHEPNPQRKSKCQCDLRQVLKNIPKPTISAHPFPIPRYQRKRFRPPVPFETKEKQ
eukprot:4387187-Amphidinium_carterae.1